MDARNLKCASTGWPRSRSVIDTRVVRVAPSLITDRHNIVPLQ
jgi:hypothetical protein